MEKSSKRIGEILVKNGCITEAQLHDALIEQKISDKFIGKILNEKGLVSNKDITQALAEQFNMTVIDLKEQHIDMELARKFSSSLLIDHKCFPLKEDEYTVTVAIVNPLDAIAMSKIEEEANPRKVNMVLATEEDLDSILKNFRQYISQNIQRLLRKKPGETT